MQDNGNHMETPPLAPHASNRLVTAAEILLGSGPWGRTGRKEKTMG